MNSLDAKILKQRLAQGCNPVDIAGYGRESTHKGYLTWILNSEHWHLAGTAVLRLLEVALKKKCEKQCKREELWLKLKPNEVRTDYEKKIGSGKVDLLVRAVGSETDCLPIELKTDGKATKDQITKLSKKGAPEIGLILLLGTSAIRDDCMPNDKGNFVPLTISEILDAWSEFDLPQAATDWLNALTHENFRLENAFSMRSEKLEEVGYRDSNHRYFALLHSVQEELNERRKEWRLYWGGYNPVLNWKIDGKWLSVAKGNAEVFWEFNNNKLVLKVWRRGDESITKNWITDKQHKLSGLKFPEKPKKFRSARTGSTWISVMGWADIPFDCARQVAEYALQIIDIAQPVLEEK
ncbi:MAG: hypothetical protein F4Z71_04850 [Gammaproteobacteria bacterium]|nr:hypothetical protein [Gammaproteobacteria bacterium]